MQLLPARPALRQIVSEAARALAQLDVARLEELALSCQALNRDLNRDLAGEPTRELSGDQPRTLGAGENSGAPPIDAAERTRLAAEAREARRDMVLFARVLDATRANVRVLERLRELRSGRVEYSAWRDPHWPSMNISPGENRLGEEARRENRQTENRRRENRYGND